MLGSLLKVLGVIVLIGGVLGLFVGGFTIVYGELRSDGGGESLTFTDSRAAHRGQAAKEAGVAIVGGSFLVSGLGFGALVAGLSILGRERAAREPERLATFTDGPSN